MFKQHVHIYANKAVLTGLSLRLLGNLARGLLPKQKRTLYLSNVLPLMTYASQVWMNPSLKGIKHHVAVLQHAQSNAACWILGAF